MQALYDLLLNCDMQVWAYPTTAMQCDWLGEHVATVDASRAIKNVIEGKEDAGWGPNTVFRYAWGYCVTCDKQFLYGVAFSLEMLCNEGRFQALPL